MKIEGVSHIDAYTQVSREVACIRIAGEERSLAPAPQFTFGPMPDHLTHSMFGSLHTGAISCYRIQDGRIGYDAVAFHKNTALWSLAFNHGEDFVCGVLARPERAGEGLPVRRIAGVCSCIHGPGYNVYGHWLVDFLPRLSVLAWAGFDIFKLRYILPLDCPLYGLEFLRLIGISSEQLIPYRQDLEEIQCDELIIPANLRTGSRLHSSFRRATDEWISRIIPSRHDIHAEQRLFASRSAFLSDRNLANREKIEALAVSAGFAIVHPERLSVAEQITLFRSARQVIGEYGSGLHNSIYGSATLHSCALRGTSHWLGFIQSSLAHAFRQPVSYVFGFAEPHARTYDFEIDPKNFRRALECLEVELSA